MLSWKAHSRSQTLSSTKYILYTALTSQQPKHCELFDAAGGRAAGGPAAGRL